MSKMTNDEHTDSLLRALALCGVTVDARDGSARIEMREINSVNLSIIMQVPVIVYASDSGPNWRIALIAMPGPKAVIWQRTEGGNLYHSVVRMDYTVPKVARHTGQIVAYSARPYMRANTIGIARASTNGRHDDPVMDITGQRWLHVYGPSGIASGMVSTLAHGIAAARSV